MSNRTCLSSVQACRIRVSRLTASGSIMTGANNLYITDAVIEVGIKMIVKAGVRFEQQNGCGQDCVIFQDCDRITGVDLDMTLCNLDAELLEMLTGGTVLTSGGNSVGYMVPSDNAVCSNGVSLEVYSKAWNTDQQASTSGALNYFHFGFPKTTWVPGDFKLDNGVLTVPVKGKGYANSAWGNGPGADWPGFNIVNCMAFFLDNNLPASVCGYQVQQAS